MPSVIAVNAGWKDLYGTPKQFSDITETFGSLSARSTVRVLTRLCFVLEQAAPGMDVQQFAETGLLGQQHRLRLADFRQRFPDRRAVVFSRVQLLCAVKLAFLLGRREGGSEPEDPSVRTELGAALLGLNDYLQPAAQEIAPEELNLIEVRSPLLKSLVCRFVLENPYNFLEYFARFYFIWTRFLPKRLKHLNSLSEQALQAAFYAEYSCDYKDCILLAFAVHIMNERFGLPDFDKRQPGVRESEFFNNCLWAKDRLKHTCTYFAGEFDDYDMDLLMSQRTAFPYDHDAFRRKPLCRDSGDLLVLDRQFMIESVGHKLFYTLCSCLPNLKQQALKTAFGFAYEDYVEEVLKGPIVASGCAFSKPPDRNGKKADFLISGHGATIVIEATTAMFSESTRFAVDRDSLPTFLNRLKKDELPQLAREIEAQQKGTNAGHRHFAVLIGLDRALSFWKVQSTLEPHYRSQLKRLIGAVASADTFRFPRLIVLSAEDTESLANAIRNGIRPRDCLDAIVAEDPDGTGSARDVLFKRSFPMHGLSLCVEDVLNEIRAVVVRDFPETD